MTKAPLDNVVKREKYQADARTLPHRIPFMLRDKRPTMRDVADEAGVSFKTVSRVINDEGGVSKDLTAQVDQAVKKLGYRPDHRARELRQVGSKAATIGFVLVDVANPFFSQLLRGIEEVASTRDCLVLAGSTDGSEEREHKLIDELVGRRVDGLIVVTSSSDTSTLESEIERGTPVVFVDIEPDLPNIDVVRSDHVEGAVLATKHLIDLGHTDVAYFGDDPAVYSAGLRLEGFLKAMTAAGLDVPTERILTGSHTEDAWHKLVLTHLRANPAPTAVFSAQNYVTIGTARALHDLGLRSTVAQVGFDEIELASMLQPGLTVVPQRPRELGRRAAELLFGRVDGSTSPGQRQILTSPIRPNGSGEIRPL